MTPKEYVAAAKEQGCIVRILDDAMLQTELGAGNPMYLVIQPATGRSAHVPLPHPSHEDVTLSKYVIETWNRRLGLDI